MPCREENIFRAHISLALLKETKLFVTNEVNKHFQIGFVGLTELRSMIC